MKLTIRLVGYSLIAIWSIWLIGRPDEIDPDGSSTSDTTIAQIVADLSSEPPPLEELESAKTVRMYIDRMVASDAGIERLIDDARLGSDDRAWSTPVSEAINEVIRVTEREQFESGELYVECGGQLCFVHGDLNANTTLAQLPLALWAASNRDEISFATAKSLKSEEYGSMFFVAAPDFKIPVD